MGDLGVLDDDMMEQIDWDHLFDNTATDGGLNFFDLDVDPSLLTDLSPDASALDFSNPSPDSLSLSVGELEQLLMKDDVELPNHDFSDAFLSDILLAPPVDCGGSGEVVDVSDAKNSNSNSSPSEGEPEKNDADAVDDKENNSNTGDADDDPISKRQKRQLRNRDAAVRSRERKKMYVRDLEIKSRYFEGECKRLGMLLQCYLAENQALRLSLQNGKVFDASMTKQESAVLLLESLLLGSLLWFLGIMCLLILPRPPRSNLEAVPLENVDSKYRGSLSPRKPGSKIFEHVVFQSFMMGKRCKASRSRMKLSSPILEVLV